MKGGDNNSSDHSSGDQYKMKDHQHRPCSVSGKKRKEFVESSSGGDNNIARTCTECGKIFWSWKALFGHMRCHPERQWRGINPPLNFRRQQQQPHSTPEEQEVAASLLLLANSNPKNKNKASASKATVVDDPSVVDQFVCSCCNKVFGSHQALGGHRASHKNVKGCFANTTITTSPTARFMTTWTTPQGPASAAAVDSSDPMTMIMPRGGDVEGEAVNSNNNEIISIGVGGGGHKCSICLRVFTTGQALGGHKRCHWEKGEPTTVPFDSSSTATATTSNNKSSSVNVVDLNFPLPPPPQPPDDDDPDSSSPLTLELRLGL